MPQMQLNEKDSVTESIRFCIRANKSTGMKQQWKLSLNSWWPEPREQKSIENIRSMAKTDFVNESRGL